MVAGANFGYLVNDDTDYSELHSGQVLTALHIPAGKYFTITPKVGVAFPLTDDASDNIRAVSVDGEETHVFGGVNITFAF
jgi:hypothetical protein